jgi:hypothetical protein
LLIWLLPSLQGSWSGLRGPLQELLGLFFSSSHALPELTQLLALVAAGGLHRVHLCPQAGLLAINLLAEVLHLGLLLLDCCLALLCHLFHLF